MCYNYRRHLVKKFFYCRINQDMTQGFCKQAQIAKSQRYYTVCVQFFKGETSEANLPKINHSPPNKHKTHLSKAHRIRYKTYSNITLLMLDILLDILAHKLFGVNIKLHPKYINMFILCYVWCVKWYASANLMVDGVFFVILLHHSQVV